MKRALIFGVGGQDGSYLAELLLDKGYEVHGTHRRSSYDNLTRLPQAARERVTLHRCELTDALRVNDVIWQVAPDEIYNMADQDEVGWSKDAPGYSVQVTYGAVATILESVRRESGGGLCPVFQPVSSTMFGNAMKPCDENSPLAPQSPYACAKAAAYLLCRHYRREHGVFVSCGVFFNHDSPRRGPNYLLQTIARQAVEVWRGKRERIELRPGPDAAVNVGWAPDYVQAAWLTLQQDKPDDYVIANDWPVHISTYCQAALTELGLDPRSCTEMGGTEIGGLAATDKIKTLGWTLTKDPLDVVRAIVRHFKGVL